jgi:hypothetical protein
LRRRRRGAAAKPGTFLTGDELTAWTASVAVLAEMSGLDAESSETVLTRAYGWGSQMYWRKEKVEVVPDPAQVCPMTHCGLLCVSCCSDLCLLTAQVAESLTYLREVMGHQQADVQKVVTGFPECVAFAVDGPAPSLKYAVDFIALDWGLEGKAAQMTLARKPKALGCRIDCRGDCKVRIRRFGFGTRRQRTVLERGTTPKRSRPTCSARHELQLNWRDWAGVVKRRRELIPHPNRYWSDSHQTNHCMAAPHTLCVLSLSRTAHRVGGVDRRGCATGVGPPRNSTTPHQSGRDGARVKW